jgi:Starch-binding associating with outer membrane
MINMKKLTINSCLILMIACLWLSSCKKADFNNNYYNPEKSVSANIPSLYAGLFNNPRVIPRYWNLYTFLIPMLGEYSQTIGYTNSNRVYEQAVNYTQNRWDDYYTGVMAPYREIEKYYNALSDSAQKKGNQLFLETARVFVYDQTAQMVDMFGDIPFTTAGQLNATGKIIQASYDKGKDIYYFILNDLKRISDYLASVSADPFYLGQLQKYDYLNGGSILQWRKYANSLRLRLAMRISYYDENTAKSIIQEILNNPTQYPLVDKVSENIQINVTGNLVSTGNDIRNGFGVNPFAPAYMVDSVMAPANDPRLPIFFTANYKGEYHGVPNTWNASRVSDSTAANYFSRYDSTTFTENNNFPGIILTAAEVSFIKAEAFERWGGGDAKAAYETGIRQSIEYYTSINNSSSFGPKDPPPTEAAIEAYLANPLIAYGSDQQENLTKIAIQKYIDFNVMQAQQAWAEWRRTKLPPFLFPTDPSSNLSPNVPNRLLYPSTERILNAANYSAVQSEDNVTTKVFWDVK